MPSGRVLNSAGPPKVICEAIVPPPLLPLSLDEPESEPQPARPRLRAVVSATSGAVTRKVLFMSSPVGGGTGLSVRSDRSLGSARGRGELFGHDGGA